MLGAMRNKLSSCCSIHCIVPPHMLESILIRGDSKMKKMVQAVQLHTDNYREDREVMAHVIQKPGMSMAAAGSNKPRRRVYDGEGKAALPGKLARKEGDPKHADQVVNEAYEGAGSVFKLYHDIYGRNSLDNNGMELVSTVHHRRNYGNAFWNGSQMSYGDGDNILFKKLTELSIIGHEFSHGVVQFSGGLAYRDQSGALNESIADVFGALTEQYKKKQSTKEATWLIGKGVFANGINGDALRSLKQPGLAYDDSILGKDPQPYHMDLYVNTTQDHGGVHINSGIPNHAFYLLAQYLGGKAWEKAGHIWYAALQNMNNSLATFADWADETIRSAATQYGHGSYEMKMTYRAWKLVGVM